MNNIATKLFVVLLGATLPVGLAACVAAPAGPEGVGSSAEAWGTTCYEATPDDTIDESGTYDSPQTYSNPDCGKSQVIVINNLQVGPSGNATFGWNDTLPSDQTDCEALFLGVYRWHLTSDFTYVQDIGPDKNGSWEAFGTWISAGPLHYCEGPEIVMSVPGGITNGVDYLFAVTARTSDSSSAPTQKFFVDASG
jgi:hypothetical protein